MQKENLFNIKAKQKRERRGLRLKAMKDAGKKLREIAAKEGISIERARQLIKSVEAL